MDSSLPLSIPAEAVGSGACPGEIMFSPLISGKQTESILALMEWLLSPVLLEHEQLSKQHKGICVLSNGCRTAEGRWPWVPRGIGGIKT